MEINVKSSDGRLNIKVSSKRLEANLLKAQQYLDKVVLEDSERYIPANNGILRNSGKIHTVVGSGEVEWNTPYAHYQYEGEKYVDPVYHCAGFMIPNVGYRSRKNVRKVPSGQPLRYYTPGTGAHWFETAKAVNGKTWIKEVKRIAGGK